MKISKKKSLRSLAVKISFSIAFLLAFGVNSARSAPSNLPLPSTSIVARGVPTPIMGGPKIPWKKIFQKSPLHLINSDRVYQKYYFSEEMSSDDFGARDEFNKRRNYFYYSVNPREEVFKSKDQMNVFLDELEQDSRFGEVNFDKILSKFQYKSSLTYVEWTNLLEQLKDCRYNRLIQTPKGYEEVCYNRYTFDGWSRDNLFKAAQIDPRRTANALSNCSGEELRGIGSLLTEEEKELLQFFVGEPLFSNTIHRSTLADYSQVFRLLEASNDVRIETEKDRKILENRLSFLTNRLKKENLTEILERLKEEKD
jgi:hypothetical protein